MEWLSTSLTPTFWAAMAGLALVFVFNAVNPKPAIGQGLHWVTKTCLWAFGIVFGAAGAIWLAQLGGLL